MAISKKIAAIPHGFEVAEHYVYLAHKKAVDGVQSGLFHAFRPSYVDLVIDDENNIPERALTLAKKLGDRARLVKIIPVADQPSMI